MQYHHDPPWVTLRSRSQTWKFCVKDFGLSFYYKSISLYQVDTLHVRRYWSKVLCSTIMTHLDDLEVKVTDTDRNFVLKVLVKLFISLEHVDVFKLILCMFVDIGLKFYAVPLQPT